MSNSDDIPKERLVTRVVDLANLPPLTPEQEERLAKLANIRDEDIDYSDIPPLTDEQLARAVRSNRYRPTKVLKSVRLDSDVIEWLQSAGKGWQTRLNGILRAAMLGEQPGGVTS